MLFKPSDGLPAHLGYNRNFLPCLSCMELSLPKSQVLHAPSFSLYPPQPLLLSPTSFLGFSNAFLPQGLSTGRPHSLNSLPHDSYFVYAFTSIGSLFKYCDFRVVFHENTIKSSIFSIPVGHFLSIYFSP